MTSQFSAKLPLFLGTPTSAPVEKVRDVLVCVTGAGVSHEEVLEHPFIASPMEMRVMGLSEPCELGRGIVIGRLSQDDAELVLNACTPRGHYFAPVRQFDQLFSFIRDVDLKEWQQHRFRWDPDDAIRDALSMSRLVRDHGFSTGYAARIANYADGEQSVMYVPPSESNHAYRLREGRDWPDRAEADELRSLLGRYWSMRETLAPRVRRALWRAEYSSWVSWADLTLPILVSGLEALTKVGRRRLTEQFKTRTVALSNDLGVEGVTTELAERMYDARSDWVHGSGIQLFATGQEAQEDSPASRTANERDALADVALLQDLLRTAGRRSVEDDAFSEVFSDDRLIESRWPIP